MSKYLDSVKVRLHNKIIVHVKIDPDVWLCETEEELHAVIHSHYGDDVMHFLEENAEGWSFDWHDDLNEEELDKLADDHYTRLQEE